jgi:hypothetical protein
VRGGKREGKRREGKRDGKEGKGVYERKEKGDYGMQRGIVVIDNRVASHIVRLEKI